MANLNGSQLNNVLQIRMRRRQLMKVLAAGGVGMTALIVACAPPPPQPAAAPPPTTAPAAAAPTPTSAPAKPAAPAPTPTAVAQPAAAPKPAAEQLAKDQIFRFNIFGEPNTIDPTLAEDNNSSVVVTQLFDHLVRYKPDLTLEPTVADSWSVSSDGKVWTFKLKDVKWSDGKPVTAKDFEYSLKRLADPKTASPYAEFIIDVKGFEDYHAALGTKEKPKQPTDAELAKLRDALGVKAVDDKTLQIELAHPIGYFVNLLAHTNLAPIRQDVVEKFGAKWTDPANIIVNGPFTLESWSPKSKIVLKRNPNYSGKAPTLERIEITFVTEETTAYASYLNNELDVSHTVADAQIPQLRTDAKLSKEIVQSTQLATYYIGFNYQKSPFDKKQVRQAFQLAIDTKTLCEKVLYGVPKPAKSFIPPGMPGHQPDIGFDFNPAKAKALLAEAGYPDGKGFPPVTLSYNTSPAHKLRMEYIQAQLKQNLGIDIQLENWEGATYFRKVATEHPPMYRAGWLGDYPHPNNFLRQLWETGSGENFSQYSNKQFDDLVRKAAAEPNIEKALPLYAEAQKIMVDDAPAIWLYFVGVFRLVKPWVKGLTPTPLDAYFGSLNWRNIQILAR